MRLKSFIISLLLLTVLLWGGVFYFQQKKDTTAPKIVILEGELGYEEGMEEALLFQGVSAWDNKDGNLDKEVVIEKIVIDREKKTAVVTYGVSDRAGNVGKLNRKMNYYTVEELEVAAAVSVDSPGENLEGGLEEILENAESQQEAISTDSAEEAPRGNQVAAVQVAAPGEESSREEVPVETPAEPGTQPEPEAPSEPQVQPEPQPEGEPSPTPGEESESPTKGSQEGEAPFLKFREAGVKTRKGSGPAWVDIIEVLRDDKDDYGTLFRTLRIQGAYDRNKVGSYGVTVTVKDRDGNESSPASITIEVVE